MSLWKIFLLDLAQLKDHWPFVLTVLAAMSSFVSTLITACTPYPRVETLLHTIVGLLSWVQHWDVGGLSAPGLKLRKPGEKTPAGGKPISLGAVLFVASVLSAHSARADVSLSSGPSIPMLEFTGSAHPVSFAPGLGYELSLGFFQFAAMGQQWDALNLSAQLFGNALDAPNGDPAGSLQVAACVGTLNNLIAIGVAVPLYGGPGGGAFQGEGHVYPVLSLSIPIAFGPFSPPVGVVEGAAGLPRGGTIYFGPGQSTAQNVAASRPAGDLTPAQQQLMSVTPSRTPAEAAAARGAN